MGGRVELNRPWRTWAATRPALPLGLLAALALCGVAGAQWAPEDVCAEGAPGRLPQPASHEIEPAVAAVPSTPLETTRAIQDVLCAARPGDTVVFDSPGEECVFEVGYYVEVGDGENRVPQGLVGRHGVIYEGNGCTLRLADQPEGVSWAPAVGAGTGSGAGAMTILAIHGARSPLPTIVRDLHFDGNRAGQRPDGDVFGQSSLSLEAPSDGSLVGQKVEVSGCDAWSSAGAGFRVGDNLAVTFTGSPLVEGSLARRPFETEYGRRALHIAGPRARVRIREWTSREDDEPLRVEPECAGCEVELDVQIANSGIHDCREGGIRWSPGAAAWSRDGPRNRLALHNVEMYGGGLTVELFDTALEVHGGSFKGEGPGGAPAGVDLAEICGSVFLGDGLEIGGPLTLGGNADECAYEWDVEVNDVHFSSGSRPARFAASPMAGGREFAILAEGGTNGRRVLHLENVSRGEALSALALFAGGDLHLSRATLDALPSARPVIFVARDESGRPVRVHGAGQPSEELDEAGLIPCARFSRTLRCAADD